MTVVSIGGSLTQRIVIVLIVISGIVGMHHLVSVSCAVVITDHGSHTAVPRLDLNSDRMRVIAADSNVTPDMNALPSNTGSICLAVLLLFTVAIPTLSGIKKRKVFHSNRSSPRTQYMRTSDPPDLKLLAISRT